MGVSDIAGNICKNKSVKKPRKRSGNSSKTYHLDSQLKRSSQSEAAIRGIPDETPDPDSCQGCPSGAAARVIA